MKIKIIDPENGNIATALGISPEREKELDELIDADTQRIVENVIKNNGKEGMSEQIERLTEYSRHVNETAYICFMCGTIAGKLRTMADMGPLGLIGMMFGGGKGGM